MHIAQICTVPLTTYLILIAPGPQLFVQEDQFCHSPSWQSVGHSALQALLSAGFILPCANNKVSKSTKNNTATFIIQ